MKSKPDADPVASAFARKRWDKATDEEKSAVGKRLTDIRWKGHKTERPASARPDYEAYLAKRRAMREAAGGKRKKAAGGKRKAAAGGKRKKAAGGKRKK